MMTTMIAAVALAAGLAGGATAATADADGVSGGWMPPPPKQEVSGGWMPAPWDCDPRYPADNYVIRPGDTASEIAAAHGVGLATLVAYNPRSIEDPDRLCVGETLYVG